MKTNKPFTYLLQVHIFICTCFCFSQNIDLDDVYEELGKYNVDNVISILKNIDTKNVSIYDQGLIDYLLGEAYLMNDNHGLAYEHTLKAKGFFSKVDSLKDVADSNINLLKILSHQNDIKVETKSILDELKHYASLKNDYKVLRTIYYRIASNYMDEEKGDLSNDYFDKYIALSRANNDTLYIAYGLMNKGSVFNDYIKDRDSALYYFKKSLSTFLKYDDTQTIAYNFNNQGRAYYNLKDYDNAIMYYLKADSIQLRENISKSELVFYENLYKAYKGKRDYKNYSQYLEKFLTLKDSINDTKQNIAISEIKEQYDNIKLRADNLESESKRKQNKNLLLGSLGLLFFGGITAFLIQKSTKRKQLLAEQEKELQVQKVGTLMKEQELASIDAMIAGQEKERQRIANDLHDDLGGMMATVKLHFNTLKDKPSPELYHKTDRLLDEAYQKVRSIAHAKNSGVIAKEGLLKSVADMAQKVSASNKLQIEVVDHGLDNRLENSLELTIFRIIQELITNVIKHANATEVIIHLTQHDDGLNIMVEDNGKGFNPKRIAKKEGMGISSIDKRVDHLNGSMNIESEMHKGTTIIIDIPI